MYSLLEKWIGKRVVLRLAFVDAWLNGTLSYDETIDVWCLTKPPHTRVSDNKMMPETKTYFDISRVVLMQPFSAK